MTRHPIPRPLAIMALAAVLASGLAAAGPASADTHWVVDATFTDGATLTGYLNFNVYDQIETYSLKTTAGPGFAPIDFKSNTPGAAGPSGGGAGTTEVTFFNGPGYTGDILTLITSKSLTTSAGDNSLLSSSYECLSNFACPAAPTVRFLGGDATLGVPEPAGWSMMLAGVALLGARLRRRRTRAAGLA